MRLDSARALKAELGAYTAKTFQKTVSLPFHATVAKTRGASGDVVKIARPMTEPVAAFGVSRIKGKARDFAIAVRIYKGQRERSRALLKKIEARGDELDLVEDVYYAPRKVILRAGSSCGHHRITVGTLGGFVKDSQNNYILSNNHVLANSDRGRRDDPIVQPGPSDIKANEYTIIGNLHSWVPLGMMQVDAALATMSNEVRNFEPHRYFGIGNTARSPVADRYGVTQVVKRGRTTKVTHGTVSAYELDGVLIDYGTARKPNLVTFNDQIEIIGATPTRAFSQGGDSGSFIFDKNTLEPFALLYGGGSDNLGIDRTLAHFMPDVLEQLGVQIIS